MRELDPVSDRVDGPIGEVVDGPDPANLAAQLDRSRLASETLYGVIGVIASSPDLDRVLHGVVDVLTRATRCHACFVYLCEGDVLHLRAASEVYAHLVGEISFGIEDGLVGWTVRHNTPAFIRERALDDPRTNNVPELEEERFQSMVAIPIPARDGRVIGGIVLHTIAPREFDSGTVDLLVHAAPLVAAPIENARLYRDTQRRVAALTKLSELSHRISAAGDRHELSLVITSGVRSLLGSDETRLFESRADDNLRLQLIASDPPAADGAGFVAPSSAMLLTLLRRRETGDAGALAQLQEALGLPAALTNVLIAQVASGDEHLGLLVAASRTAPAGGSQELLDAVSNQLVVALKKTELIARLTEENVVRDLFDDLEHGRADDAVERAHQLKFDLGRAHVVIHGQPALDRRGMGPWASAADRVEIALRRIAPGMVIEADRSRLRALLPLGSGGTARELGAVDDALRKLGAGESIALSRSEVRRGPADLRLGLREAHDAGRVVRSLQPGGGALAYGALGAYRYLVHLTDGDFVHDPYLSAVREIEHYDRRRSSQLVLTLEQHLGDRTSLTETARVLNVHPNTLRQRLERIETLTGLDLQTADLLALELAVKLARLQPVDRVPERDA